MNASTPYASDQEWDLVQDQFGDASESLETGPSLLPQKHGTRTPARPSRSSTSLTTLDSQRPQGHCGHHCSIIVQSFKMLPNLTAEEIEEAEERNRQAERVTSLGWIFGGVHKSDEHKAYSSKPTDPAPHKYAEDDRSKLRAEYLAWMFGGVHIDKSHAAWNKLSAAEQDALRTKLSQDQQRTDAQMERLFQGVRVKWCIVMTTEGKEKVRVIEDSGSANNWISNAERKRLGYEAQRGDKITGMTLTGEEFSAEEYVDLPWVGKASHQGVERFFIAPEKAPIDLLVGEAFLGKHPGVFMEQEPTPQLLTLQSGVKIEEQRQIDVERRRMEEQASMLERRRRPNPPPAPPTQPGTHWNYGPRPSTSIEKAPTYKSSK